MENVQRQENFNQVCVMAGTLLDSPEQLVDFFQRELGIRIQYLEEIKTFPDTENGINVEETGGRNDIFFAIHDEDISKFVIPRFHLGARWIEDVLAKCNYHSRIYPERVFDYCKWNEEHLAVPETV